MFLFLGMRTLVMNQIGQSRLDVLKQVSERSNIVKNSVITISNLYRYDERVLDCLESDKRNFVEETSARRYLYDLKRTYDRVFHDVGMTYEIVILGNNGFQYFSYAQYDFEDLENQLWYRKSYDSEDDIVFVSSFLNKFGAPDEKEGYVFSAFRRVLDKNGKEAVTHYKVLERFGQATYIECRLETGRTHQIRVHMASLGHPLLGDTVYGSSKNPYHLQGQALHAMILGFIHPVTGEYMEFEAPIPEYFSKLLDKLRK